MTEQRPKAQAINRIQTVANKSEEVSEDSSDFDQEYENDRYSFLEIGRVLNLQAPVFSEEEAALMVKSILVGLSHIHALNLVHRDIKPENIIVLPREIDTTGTVDNIGQDPEFSER